MSNDSTASTNAVTVVHVAPTPFFSDRGCHVRVKGVIAALNRKSLRNILCTYHLGRDITGIETLRTARIPGYHKLEAGPSAFKYFADILLFFKVCAVIRKRRPQIIHGHLHEGALIGWAARTCFFWRKIPLVFDMQGSLVGELTQHGYFGGSGLLRRVFWSIEYLITRLPDYFTCSSQHSARILAQEFNVAADRIVTVHDGIDVAPVDSEIKSEFSRRLALPPGRPVAIYTGALLEAKGLGALKEIILEARRRHVDCHYLIVGYPVEPMLEFVRTQGIEEFCTLTGRIPFEQLQNYLAVATLAIEPKAGESGEASGKLLNYMGAALPVACFDTDNNREMLGEDGYFVAPGSVVKFVDRIEEILESPPLAKHRGEAGRARAAARFSWDVSANDVYSVYQSCLRATTSG